MCQDTKANSWKPTWQQSELGLTITHSTLPKNARKKEKRRSVATDVKGEIDVFLFSSLVALCLKYKKCKYALLLTIWWKTEGLYYYNGIISWLSICVCVLLHMLNICVFKVRVFILVLKTGTPGSKLLPSTIDPFHHSWTLTTSRCWRPESDDQTKYFHFDKKIWPCVFWLTGSLEEEDPQLSNTHTYTLMPQCRSRNSVDIPRNSLSSKHNFLSSLFYSFALMNVDPKWPPTERYLQGEHLRVFRHQALFIF